MAVRGSSPLSLCIACCMASGLLGQARHEFGFSLNPTAQGDLHALFIYTVMDGKVLGSVPMRSDFFVLQASGMMESVANLESIDLFDASGIVECGAWTADGAVAANLKCSPLLDIWKLRYRSGMGMQPGEGWAAEEYRPSDRQQVILQFYRSTEHDDWHGPYYGKDAFRLLRDMQDPAWVGTYKLGG